MKIFGAFCQVFCPEINKYRVFIKYSVFFQEFLKVESFEGLYSDVGEGGVAVNCEKNTIFPEHPGLGGLEV